MTHYLKNNDKRAKYQDIIRGKFTDLNSLEFKKQSR